MLSKMVTDRLKATGAVLSALQTFGPRVASRAGELLSPLLRDGEKLPDIALLGVLVQRLLEQRAHAMESADSEHNDELSDDAAPRESRDASARELYSTLVEVKQAVSTLFGDALHATLKLPKEIPQDPAVLWRLGGEVREALAGAKLPKPKLAAVKSFDAAPWVEQIAAPTERLGTALADVARETREAQGTLVAKTRAIAAYDEAFSTGVAFVTALLRLVGEHEHADRLRPSARRPGTLEEPEAPPPAAPDEPAAPPP
jgi:hypothetical protein